MGILALITEANQQFFEAAAQVIPVLLLAAAIGEARLKIRNLVNVYAAMFAIFIVASAVVVGEVAALRVLVTGDSSQREFGLTALSLGLGFGFVVQYLAFAAYRDIAGPEAEPTQGVAWVLAGGGLIIGVGTVIGLTA
jgi:hypothetical protein